METHPITLAEGDLDSDATENRKITCCCTINDNGVTDTTGIMKMMNTHSEAGDDDATCDE